MATRRLLTPKISERQICMDFFNIFLRLESITKKRLIVHHIANEGKRSRITGLLLKKQGMRPGATDYDLIFADRPAILIEVKTLTGRLSSVQKDWHRELIDAGHEVYTVRSINELLRIIIPHIHELPVIERNQLVSVEHLESFLLLTNKYNG